jgi:hypothetical protein
MVYNIGDEMTGDVDHVNVDVGGVWMIGAVHVEEKHAETSIKNQKPCGGPPPELGAPRYIEMNNRFMALASEDDEDDEDEFKTDERKDVNKWKGWTLQRGREEVNIGAVEKSFKGGCLVKVA